MPRIDEHLAPLQAAKAKTEPMDPARKVRLQKAVRDFEAVLVGYMLKNMRGSVQKSEMFGEGFGGDLLDSMFDGEIAKHVSRNSQMGLAEMLYKKMTGESLPSAPRAVPDKTVPMPVRVHAKAPSVHVAQQDAVRTAVKVPPASAKAPSTIRDRVDSYASMIDTAAQKHGVDPNIIRAVIATESAGKSDARSSKHAKGLMQLIDSTAADMGVKDVWNPEENIQGGTKYLKQMLERFDGNLKLALASYNAGPGAVEKHQGVPPYRETRDYINRVMRYLRIFEQETATHEQ